MRQSENEMTEQIFLATERLMAAGGLHNLSMHKIAKEANISAGTIYIYFKSKEELLKEFARRVFTLFSKELEKNYDENQPHFEQYRQMWWNIWHYLQNNPMIVVNMSQYLSLPDFYQICMEQEKQTLWYAFCQKANQAGVLCDLPPKILFSLGLESAINLAYDHAFIKTEVENDILEEVIIRTWRSMQK
ncbi:TetR/AcrR family transcriptional regulator [Avibacterium endocarditidis]|uniref:TetR/AcrR family transcriptional regulator n=1 Tax=Avibacterium endocarditidis TaxID=380674 RepID=UPI0039F060E9